MLTDVDVQNWVLCTLFFFFFSVIKFNVCYLQITNFSFFLFLKLWINFTSQDHKNLLFLMKVTTAVIFKNKEITSLLFVFSFHSKARIFSYLTIDDGEIFPGNLACTHRGTMKKLTTGENLLSEMSQYFDFLAKNAENSIGLWTSPYLDAWGLGLMVTHAIPCISKVDNRCVVNLYF